MRGEEGGRSKSGAEGRAVPPRRYRIRKPVLGKREGFNTGTDKRVMKLLMPRHGFSSSSNEGTLEIHSYVRKLRATKSV